MKHYPQRIMLADHSEDSYELIRGLLGNCNEGNCDLHWQATYEAGLEVVLECRYDLYLIDYSIGRYAGLELLQEAAKKQCPAPVILLTQQDDPEIELAAIKNAASDLLVKDRLDAYLLDRSIRHAVKLTQVELERDSLLEARHRREAENLGQATTVLTSALDLDQVIEDILLHLAQVVPYDSTCLFLKKNDQLYAVAARGHPASEQVIDHSYRLEDDVLFEETQRTLQPIYISDAQTDSQFLNWGGTNHVRG